MAPRDFYVELGGIQIRIQISCMQHWQYVGETSLRGCVWGGARVSLERPLPEPVKHLRFHHNWILCKVWGVSEHGKGLKNAITLEIIIKINFPRFHARALKINTYGAAYPSKLKKLGYQNGKLQGCNTSRHANKNTKCSTWLQQISF